MRSQDGAVQQDMLHIWVIGKMLMHLRPYLVLTPAGKALIDCVPIALLFGKQPPLGSAAQDPQNRFHELPAFCFLSSIGSRMLLQKCVDLFPLIIS